MRAKTNDAKASARVSMPLNHPVLVDDLPALAIAFAGSMAATSGQPVERLIPVATMYIVDACKAGLSEVEAYYPVTVQ